VIGTLEMPAKELQMDQLLTPKDVQQILKVSLSLVYRMYTRGQLPHIRWDAPGEGERKKTMVRFEKDAVVEFINKHRRNGHL
jgi:predicted DNA-binding transcriptional regulator AlpA